MTEDYRDRGPALRQQGRTAGCHALGFLYTCYYYKIYTTLKAIILGSYLCELPAASSAKRRDAASPLGERDTLGELLDLCKRYFSQRPTRSGTGTGRPRTTAGPLGRLPPPHPHRQQHVHTRSRWLRPARLLRRHQCSQRVARPARGTLGQCRPASRRPQ